jgi:hypothetical protein
MNENRVRGAQMPSTTRDIGLRLVCVFQGALSC